nr:gustatory receptor 38 [Papilio machaon]
MLNHLKSCLNPKPKVNDNLCINDIFKPIYTVITFLGLFPYSVKFQQNKTIYRILRKSIYVNTIYGVSVVLTIYVFLVLHIREVFLSSDSSPVIDVLLTKINYVIEIIIVIIFIIVTYVNAFLNRHKYVKMLNIIMSTWNDLSKHYKNVGDLKRIYYKVHLLLKCLFLVILIQCCLNFLKGESLWRMILMYISFNSAQTLQLIMILFYYVTIMMLVILLSNLEKQITQLHNKTNEDKCFVQMKAQTLTVRQIEQLYNKAFDAKSEINIIFQYPLLVCIFHCFYGIVNESLIMYQGLVVKKSTTVYEIFNCSFWIIFHLLKIFLLASSGHALKMKVRKIGHALLALPTAGHDGRWYMEVQHFTSVITCKNIVIVLFDCISLDATLMYNTLSSASLYLIILVQIDRTNDD